VNKSTTDLDYLRLLSRQYSSIRAVSTGIISREAVLELPKGTEHFISDVHGEYESFRHVLKNGSGIIKWKIEETFGTRIPSAEKRQLATLIYYPEEKLDMLLRSIKRKESWYRITLLRLITLCRVITSKYSPSRIPHALDNEFGTLIEDLLQAQPDDRNRKKYYSRIIDTIISIDRADDFIITICRLIQRFSVDRLHIIGDIFDRGPGSEIIMDTLLSYHSVDIQWGNHDILWMGAAAGSRACIANVLRVALRYCNLNTLEGGYGINLLPLATFALEIYHDDLCPSFLPHSSGEETYNPKTLELMARMHKAITIIQFKLEGQLIDRRPDLGMKGRNLLKRIDYLRGTIDLDGADYSLNDTNFPTVNPENPCRLTDDEEEVINLLQASFSHSDKLQRHSRFLFARGSIYLVRNSNLLYHGCIPMKNDGSFEEVEFQGKKYQGRSLLDYLEQTAREGYFGGRDTEKKSYGKDIMWYLWSGSNSPLFGKEKMATFERHFIDDSNTHREEKNPYYQFRDQESSCTRILREFGLNPKTSHIINGHVPVEVRKGESPIKANGKLLVIDGGFARAYQKKTGIAGYTLIYNPRGLLLASHEPFESTRKAITEEKDILSTTVILEKSTRRLKIKDTDQGRIIQEELKSLQLLLRAYREGRIAINE
jgi:fructose-1,6-bisphosphatase III